MHPLINIAVRAARRAGNLMMREFSRVDSLRVTAKGRKDFVTEVDRAAEREIIDVIRRAHPDHAFIGEETGEKGTSEYRWIIDPLDGTTNYIHGHPQFGVSVALEVRGRLEHGVVYAPFAQELFTASRGDGALLDGRRIRVSRTRHLGQALLGTGFPIRDPAQLAHYLPMLKAVIGRSHGARRQGSAALDLAWVAAGRLDGFWELGLQPWDVAAGILLVREAGGMASDLGGDPSPLTKGDIIAANPGVFNELMKLLYPLHTESNGNNRLD